MRGGGGVYLWPSRRLDNNSATSHQCYIYIISSFWDIVCTCLLQQVIVPVDSKKEDGVDTTQTTEHGLVAPSEIHSGCMTIARAHTLACFVDIMINPEGLKGGIW